MHKYIEKYYPPDLEGVTKDSEITFVVDDDGWWSVQHKTTWVVLNHKERKIMGSGKSPTRKSAIESGKIVFLRTIAKYA